MATPQIEHPYVSVNPALAGNVVSALASLFPVASDDGKWVLQAKNIRISHDKFDAEDLRSHQRARVEAGNRTIPITADLELVHEGKTVSRRSGKIGDLPLMGVTGSFVVGGNDWFVPMAQQRRKPGAYTREKANGEFETAISVPKLGMFKLTLDPEKGVLKFWHRTTSIDWYGLVKALGATDDEVAKAIGPALLEVNKKTSYEKDVDKLYASLLERSKVNPHLVKAGILPEAAHKSLDPAVKLTALKQALAGADMDPFVTSRTLGAPHTAIDKDMLLASARRISATQRGDEAADDPDAPEFKTAEGIDDLLPERIRGKVGRYLVSGLKRLLGKETDLTKLVSPTWANVGTIGYFGGAKGFEGGLAHTADIANPLALLSERSKLTLMGEGGIQEERAITDAARLVRPTAAGFIDIVHTPEGCYTPDMEVFTEVGWKRWPVVTMADRLACLVNGRVEYHHPIQIQQRWHDGAILGATTDRISFTVTPEHRMRVRRPTRTGDQTDPEYRVLPMSEVYGTKRLFQCGGHLPLVGQVSHFVLPLVTAKGAGTERPGMPPVGAALKNVTEPIPMRAWCRFMGWYLSEGNAVTASRYHVTITQKHTSMDACADIESMLGELPFRWRKHGDRRYTIWGKQLAFYCRGLGKSREKGIPAEIFQASPDDRKAFLECLLAGDGRKRTKGAGERGKSSFSKYICYTTSSKRLADDVYRLLFELGESASISFSPDLRDPKYVGTFEVHIHSFWEREVTNKNVRHPTGQYHATDYHGPVHCATVPGSFMFVRKGDGFGFWCGNSDIGVTTHAAANVKKTGKTLSTLMYRVKNGVADWKAPVYVTTEEAADAVVSYPEFWSRETGKPLEPQVRANRNGQIHDDVDPKTVAYVLPSGSAMFDHTSNAALFLANTHAVRGMMAGKHLTQALPLVNREIPLAVPKTYKGQDLMRGLGQTFTIQSRVDGIVESVKPDCIVVSGVKHWLFDHYPMQAKVSLHHIPVVKVGDHVKKDQLLADTNYSRDGRLALGVNLRSAYTPWRNGGAFEDAIPISESAAQKLASEHVHREVLWLEDGLSVNAKLFMAQYPTQMTAENLAKLDDTGVIKVGQQVKPNEVLVAAVKKREFEARDKSAKNLASIHKMLQRPYSNAALVWDEDFIGTVLRVTKLSDRIEVHLKTIEPVRVGDKLSMSSAAKGTVSAILPDDKMPRDEKGRPIEVIFNPIGVLGRINPSQTIEQAAGKLVRDGGEKFEFTNFEGDPAAEITKRLKAKGLKHEEFLFDPTTGRKTERPVGVGYNYVLKLDHPVRKKFSARGRDGYTMDEAPTSGKGKGGQSFDQLTTYALLGHDAHAILGESAGIRGSRNDDFWEAYQAGEQPPPPKVPFAFEKLRNYMTAMGIHTEQSGNTLHYMPITDKKVMELSNGEIRNARQVRAENLAAEKGGLFDEEVTGGLFGNEWAHIEMGRQMPHPLYEKVVRELCGLTQAEFYGLLGETMTLDPKTGKIAVGGTGLTGATAFKKLLSFDVNAKLRETKEKLKTAVGSDANKYHRITQYLRGLQKSGLRPEDAYLTSKLPVVPPKYRSIIELPTGVLKVADANLLYRDAVLTRNMLQEAEKDKSLPPSELGKARLALYDTYAAVVGVGKPLTERRDEDLRGFAQIIKGKTNKTGLFQSQLSRRRNDYTGRSTIEPDASLGPDEIGIPEEMAWTMYEPIVVRNLVKNGWAPAEAAEEVRKRTMAARNALTAVLATHPVIYSRAPALHRWSAGAAMPRLTPGKEIKISPIVVGPYGADHDGDTVFVHPPITEPARQEAFNLLPSKNLIYDKDRSLAYSVDKDIIAGVFALTRKGRPSGSSFKTSAEAIQAYQDNKQSLFMDSIVKVEDRPGQWTIGQLIFFSLVPPQFSAGLTMPIDGEKLKNLLTRVAKEAPAQYNTISRKITQAGFEAAARAGGITATVQELVLDRSKVTRLLKSFQQELSQAKNYKDKQRLAVKLYNEKYKPQFTELIKDHLGDEDLGYGALVASGASKKNIQSNLEQFLISPGLVQDVHDEVVPAVIGSSYGAGMRPSDYLLTSPGARAGQAARSLMTAKPGYLAKEIAASVGPIRIGEPDCKTQHGIEAQLDEPDVDLLDRHLLKDIPGTTFRRNDVVTPEMLSRLRGAKKSSIWIRSPMTCESSQPPCQMCAGRRADGKLHPVGSNIGYNYGQAASERSTQLVMRMFHSGGAYGAGHSLKSGFGRLQELLKAPDIVSDQGTIATTAGKISNIAKAPQGGHYIYVNGVEHYAYPARKVLVKVGQAVSAGDALTDGSLRPQDIAKHKGLLAAQQYVVTEARNAYQQAGATVRRPVLEVLAAGVMRYVKITDDGGEPDLAIGDILHENDYKTRKARNQKVAAEPVILGLGDKPLATSNDLLERLNFEHLTESLQQVPAIGGKSDLTGSKSPIPGLAYGASFRRSK